MSAISTDHIVQCTQRKKTFIGGLFDDECVTHAVADGLGVNSPTFVQPRSVCYGRVSDARTHSVADGLGVQPTHVRPTTLCLLTERDKH